MLTELEDKILKNCAWSDKDKSYLGIMVHNIKTEDGRNIAHVVSKLTKDELKISYSTPDSNGETIIFVLNRNTQKIDAAQTDTDINEDKDITSLLAIVKNTIKGKRGAFMPTQKLEENNVNKSNPGT